MTRTRAKADRRRADRADASDAPPEAPAAWPERRFGPILAAVMLAGLLLRIIVLVEYLRGNPLAGTPINDAETYWLWAERIAGGSLSQDIPFFSAPLYPYALGALRAVGGGLTAAYLIQVLLDLLTTGVLAVVARRRFGAGVGLLAAALFLLLLEPASSVLRILPSSLELLLVTITWAALVAVQERPTLRRHVVTGAVLGVLCLAYAPAMLLVAAVLPWLAWPSAGSSDRWPGGVIRAAACAAAVAVVIAPATVHNLAATGELILIRSGSGITLRQGNHPDSTGGYTRIPGISIHRDRMHEDVLRVYTEATGRPPTWNGADAYFRGEVLDDWRSAPGRAVSLAARKLYWFLSGKNYGDIYQPAAEIATGLTGGLRLAPLPLPWLIGPALVGLALMLRHPVRSAPEWLLVAVPLFVVVVFFYSPRYRLPAAPALVVLAAWAIARGLRWREHPRTTIAVAASLVAALALTAVNRGVRFDLADPGALSRHVAHALHDQGDVEAAIVWERRGLEHWPDDVDARLRLGNRLRDLGRLDEALREYALAESRDPNDARVLRRMGEVLFEQRRFAEAESVLTRAVALAPDDPVLLSRLAGAIQLQGRREEAGAAYARALELAPDDMVIRFTYADLLMRLGRPDEARRQLERVIAIDPRNVDALHALGLMSAMADRLEEAADYARRGLAIDPESRSCEQLLQRIQQLQAERSRSDP